MGQVKNKSKIQISLDFYRSYKISRQCKGTTSIYSLNTGHLTPGPPPMHNTSFYGPASTTARSSFLLAPHKSQDGHARNEQTDFISWVDNTLTFDATPRNVEKHYFIGSFFAETLPIHVTKRIMAQIEPIKPGLP